MRNDFESNYLMHHGILGQKWGIRKYQNPDGSLTPAGRERYGIGPGRGVDDISSEKGIKRRTKDLKKAIAINDKKRGKEYSKIANNPENFLGLNKKHGKKIEEYSAQIKKGEEELKRLKIIQDNLKAKEKETPKSEDRKESIADRVEYAKETGMFDMEFLERNLDLDPVTEEQMSGKKLYDAYEKFLEEEYNKRNK